MLELRCELYRGAVNRVAPALGPCPERCDECSPTGELAVQTPLPAGEGRAPGPGGLLITHYKAFQRSDGITLCFDSCRSTLGNGPDRRKTGGL